MSEVSVQRVLPFHLALCILGDVLDEASVVDDDEHCTAAMHERAVAAAEAVQSHLKWLLNHRNSISGVVYVPQDEGDVAVIVTAGAAEARVIR